MLRKNNHIWRSDITGLRALAVIPVVLYHAFPNLLSGGFIGVDIFFVISGYLISGILFRQIKDDSNIDFAAFYGKRVRRIFPNLILLLLFVAIAGCFILYPKEYEDLGRQIYSSAVFVQNFRLLSSAGDYFGQAAETQPLLHLWSLSIEEQFYLIFPLLCWVLWQYGRKNENVLGFVILFLTLASLIGCVFVQNKSFDFYFPLTRFWELGLGILVSYLENFKSLSDAVWSSRARNILSLLGAAFILIPVVGYTKQTAFPGWTSIPPVMGAVLLILSGTKAWVNRLLSLKFFVLVGLISYSWYLWHWPILVYGKLINPNLSNIGLVCLLVLSAVVSVVVYRYVETPARLVSVDKSKKYTAIFAVGMLCVFCGGETLRLLKGIPVRCESVIEFANGDRDWSYPHNLIKNRYNGVAVNATINGTPEILVIGDSHAEQYADRIQAVSKEKCVPVIFVTCGGCPLTLNLANLKGERVDDECRGLFKNALTQLIKDRNIRTVVVANRWGNYAVQGKDGACEQFDDRCIPLEQGGFKAGFSELMRYIQRFNKKVYVVLDAPWDDSSYNPRTRVPLLAGKNYKKYLSNVPFPEQKDWIIGNKLVEDVLQGMNNVAVINPVPYICPNNLCNLEGYKDDDHLRSSWVKDHAVWIDQIFED